MACAARGDGDAKSLESSFHGSPFDGPGHELNGIGQTIAGRRELSCIARDAAVLASFRLELHKGARIVVHVGGPLWVSRLPEQISGPHGALCAAAERMKPLHSVVLVASGPGCFYALDPFHNPDGQPIEVPDEELRYVLTGFAAIVIPAA